MTMLCDVSGMMDDWEQELQASDCPFRLNSWTGILAACLFCASIIQFSKPIPVKWG